MLPTINEPMKKLYLYSIFILFFAGIILSQVFFDTGQGKVAYIEPLVLKANVVKAADLGLDNAAADYEWLSMIQYFGGGESPNYAKLPDYLATATELDPKFSYPYAFGALVLPTFGFIDQGITLAQKGVALNLPDWQISYYLATTYFINKKDNADAAKYFDIAAHTPGAPDNIQKVAASFGSNSSDRQKTEQIWLGIYNNSKDEVVKARAKNYILHFETMDFLEQAGKEYYQIYGKYPAIPEDLVKAKILNAVPPDPFNMKFTFDASGKVTAN
jgi:hypothetical protein